MDKELKGRVAIVGGGSKGLGKGCALELAKKGADIVICSREEEHLRDASKDLEDLQVNVLTVRGDMSKAADNEKLINETLAKFGRIDILVNNSGGPPAGNFASFSEEEWENAFQSVLMYNIRMTTRAIPEMKKNNWGRIINITSLSVKEPAATLVLSNVFRSGVVSFAKTISKELIKSGITINNLCPGAFKTDRAKELIQKAAEDSNRTAEEVEQANVGNLPLGRYQQPEELGAITAFLCGESAAGITGTTIAVDGGISNSLL